METTNATYGSGYTPLATPALRTGGGGTHNAAAASLPLAQLPHLRGAERNYPYVPRPKTQVWTLVSTGSRMVPLEKGSARGDDVAEPPVGEDSALRLTAGTSVPVHTRTASGILSRSASRCLAPDFEPTATVTASSSLLCFYAYTQEGVPESATEASRIRKMQVQYHPADDTIEIHEPREDNSGMIQGPFLYRHRIPRAETDELAASSGAPMRMSSTSPPASPARSSADRDGGGKPAACLTWADLAVGSTITAYGRSYYLYDADAFTRKWYAEHGTELAPAEPVPTDAEAARRAATRRSADDGPKVFHKTMFPQKLYAEARLGKFIRNPEARRKFQSHDGKVLRFDCVWDDSASECGDVHHLVLQYFLADESLELRFMHTYNDGRIGPGSQTLVRKMSVPKDWVTAKSLSAEEAKAIVLPADIVIGRSVNVFGRDIQVRSCDAATRAWYASADARAEFGVSPQPDNIVETATIVPAPEFVPPPHNGIGSEEDSLQSCYTFNVKPLKPNFTRWATHDGTIFRFYARLAGAKGAEARRTFTIACYPADETMSIYEPPIKNSGYDGGVFLRRDKHRKPEGGMYSADDFHIGSDIVIHSRRFEITGADAFTTSALGL